MRIRATLAAALLIAGLTLALAAKSAPVSATVKGYVIDSSCAFTKNLEKPISEECAISCAKSGSPLVILAENGAIYWPISGETPAAGQNDKLRPYAAQKVTVTGKVFTRGGSHAIVIEKVEPLSAPK